jgi:Lon protease-like protein
MLPLTLGLEANGVPADERQVPWSGVKCQLSEWTESAWYKLSPLQPQLAGGCMTAKLYTLETTAAVYVRVTKQAEP